MIPAIQRLTTLIVQGRQAAEGEIRKAVDLLFGERFPRASLKDVQIRDAYGLAKEDSDAGVPWAGLINPDNPASGPYGGTSLVWFPGETTSLIGFGVGTRGISPDEGILSRPGHRRRIAALRRVLAKKGVLIWSKADPTALGTSVLQDFTSKLPEFANTFKRYSNRSDAAVPRQRRPEGRERPKQSGDFARKSGSEPTTESDTCTLEPRGTREIWAPASVCYCTENERTPRGASDWIMSYT